MTFPLPYTNAAGNNPYPTPTGDSAPDVPYDLGRLRDAAKTEIDLMAANLPFSLWAGRVTVSIGSNQSSATAAFTLPARFTQDAIITATPHINAGISAGKLQPQVWLSNAPRTYTVRLRTGDNSATDASYSVAVDIIAIQGTNTTPGS